MSGTGDEGDRLRREAASWFARMRASDADESRTAFEAWLAADPAHREAYNRAAEVFALGKLLAHEEVGRDGLAPAGPPPPAPTRRRALVLATATAALLAMLAAGFLSARNMAPAWLPDRAREVASAHQASGLQRLSALAGERRTARLADGSRVTLEGGSELVVRLDRAERRLELVRGSVRFDVAHAPMPFVVYAAGGKVTARGTVFEVALRPGRRVDVRLIEGRVDVLPPAASTSPAQGPLRLAPGQHLSFGAMPGPAPARQVPAVRAGHAGAPAPAEFEDVSVALIIAHANRGAARPIRLADAELGERRVSGRFRTDDTRLLAQRLALLFDLREDLDDPGEIVLAEPR